ncbi:RNA-directed DNA polymerase, eukaryota, reverse transcriptase zinc-binding domain protein [Tanacetum coccineum]
MRMQPSFNVTKEWSHEMVNYFKRSWEADREKEKDISFDAMEGIVEDVSEDESEAIKNLVVDECSGGCRITVGWNSEVVQVVLIHSTSQMMSCLIENIQSHEKMYCNFIYADNKGMDKRAHWKDLILAKHCTNGNPWVIMSDFNITFKIEKHYAGKSTISNDMQEFLDCVNNIRVEDLCMSGMFYTWIKSPSSPNTSILKKLDRVMANDEFTSKKKSFKFANFISEKSDFLPIVASWKNGDVFERVTCLRSKLKSVQLEVSLFPHDTEKKKIVVSIFEEFSEAIKDEEYKRNMNRIMRINNEKGDCLEGSHIADEFVNHFHKFLGQSYPVVQLDSLGDIFTNFLTSNEAKDMVKDVTDLEIKNAMFGIGDSKAPGSDGYTACFFKKAWPIIGNDVCYAIKEFFKTGKILKEINSTLIALIPKTFNPKLVTEFRPIACWRNIQDNILLTQELLKGYNRKGGSKRYALKIDIAKAYAIISWEFLRSILIKFGFHWKMVDWITTCISSSAFSICVNGEIHGYFCGGRCLRQGDLISPYLFTLVMRVFTLIVAHKTRSPPHFRYTGCKDLMLTYLCFADDLIVLCHGDKSSISIIKEALKEFSVVSGLKPNLCKSTIFFGNVNNGDQRSILKVLPFKVGSFLAKCLGVPLVTKRLGREDCKHLVDMVKNKVNDWKNKFLSYARRMQLIASVLVSMQIYWAFVFLLPKSTVKDIERVLKGFLWCQRDLARGKAKIAWKTLCKQGGLGFKDLGLWNEVLLTKNVWNIVAHKERDKAIKHIEIKVGNGKRTYVWYDKWNDVGALSQVTSRRDIYDARFENNATLSHMIVNNQWVWHQEWSTSFPDLITLFVPLLNDKQDKVIWRGNDGNVKIFSTRQTWHDYRPHWSECQYAKEVWYAVKVKGYLKNFKSEWMDTINYMAVGHGRNIKSVVSRVVFGAIVYYIWQEINKRCFSQERRSVKDLCDIMMDIVKLRLLSLKVKSSSNVKQVAKD